MGVIKGDTKSLEYSIHGVRSKILSLGGKILC